MRIVRYITIFSAATIFGLAASSPLRRRCRASLALAQPARAYGSAARLAATLASSRPCRRRDAVAS